MGVEWPSTLRHINGVLKPLHCLASTGMARPPQWELMMTWIRLRGFMNGCSLIELRTPILTFPLEGGRDKPRGVRRRAAAMQSGDKCPHPTMAIAVSDITTQ